MTTQLKWRLSKLPTPSELVELVANKLITQEEAKDILFTSTEEVDTDALKKEIEFLRKVVEDLSKSKSETVRVIEKHINHYRDWTWYQPYHIYCSSGITSVTSGSGAGGTTISGTSYPSLTNANTASYSSSLTNLKTF